MTVPIAFPFIEVNIDTSGLAPVAQRSPGVVAVVGDGNGGGTQPAATPVEVTDSKDAESKFGAGTKLTQSLVLALMQDPKPSKVYGVKTTAAGDYEAALRSLEAVGDVTFVSLAGEIAIGTGGPPATDLMALKAHVENMSAAGQKRIGVAMVDPAKVWSSTYITDVGTDYTPLKSDSSRMVLIAARGADADVATAAMAAMAGYDPQVSLVLKKIRGVKMPIDKQYSPSEIKALSNLNIIPIIDPELIPGEGLHFAEGRTFTTDMNLLYVDIVRVLDDIDFRLKAGLIAMVGDARITKSGLTKLKVRTEGILEPLERSAVIDGFLVQVPVLDILNTPDATWTAGDRSIVAAARSSRQIELLVSVTYGPAVHHLLVKLQPKF
jgi:hypothetical protein